MRIFAVFFTLIIIATILSCTHQKESPSQSTTTPPFISLQQAVIKLSDAPQLFAIDPEKPQTIITGSGIKITIPARSLVNPDGTTPTGTITINIKEVTTRSEMILNSISTTDHGNIIESFGMIHIEAQNNNQSLSVKKGNTLQAIFPKRTTDAGSFYGLENSNGIIEWEVDSSSMIADNYLEDVLQTGRFDVANTEIIEDSQATQPSNEPEDGPTGSAAFAHSFAIVFDQMTWINCDRYIDMTDAKPLTVTTNKDHNPYTYAVFKDINSVMVSKPDETGLIHFGPIPPDYMVTLFLMDKIDDQWFVGSQQIKTGSVDSVHVELRKVSEQQLLQEIKKLDSSN